MRGSAVALGLGLGLAAAAGRAGPGESWLGVGMRWLGDEPEAAEPAGGRPAGSGANRLGTGHLRHQDSVETVAFSPDGATLASGGVDRVVRLWRIPDGESRGELALPAEPYYCPITDLAYSPDGRFLAVADGHRVRVFSTADRVLAYTSPELAAAGQKTRVGFADSGRLTYASGGDVVGIGLPQGIELYRATPFRAGAAPGVLDLDAFGSRLAVASADGRAGLLEAATGRTLATWEAGRGPVYTIRFTPDGTRLVSGGEDGRIAVASALDGTPVFAHDLGQGTQSHYRVSPDGTLLARTSGLDGVVIHRLATGEVVRKLSDQQDLVQGLAFSPDGTLLATAGRDGRVGLYEVATGTRLARDRAPGHTAGLASLAFSPDGRTLVSASDDRTLGIWDLSEVEPARFVPGHSGRVVAVEFAGPQTLVSAGVDGEIRTWAWPGMTPRGRFSSGTGLLTELAASPDGRTLALPDSGALDLWDLATGQRLRRIAAFPDFSGPKPAFSHDGRWLVACSTDRTLRVFDVATGAERARFTSGAPGIFQLAVSPVEPLAALARWEDLTAVLLRLPDLEPVGSVRIPSVPHAIAFSQSGKRLAIATQEPAVRVFEGPAWQERAVLGEHRGTVRSLRFSPDGALLAGASGDTRVALWSLPAE